MIATQLQKWKSFEVGPPKPGVVRAMLGSLFEKSVADQTHIIEGLNDWTVISGLWFVMANYREKLEELAKSSEFLASKKASLLCSKIYYCCEEYQKALNYALDAAEEFKLVPEVISLPKNSNISGFSSQDELYVNKIIMEALDDYKVLDPDQRADTKLEAFIDRIFCQHLNRGDTSAVIHLGLDLCRIDMIQQAFSNIPSKLAINELLVDTINKSFNMDISADFREQVLTVVFNFFQAQPEPDFVSMCECLIKLENATEVATVLTKLASSGETNLLLAYQLAFDLYENATQQFISQLEGVIRSQTAHYRQNQTDESNESKESGEEEADNDDEDSNVKIDVEVLSDEQPISRGQHTLEKSVADNLHRILSGEETIKQHMQFLIKNNATDMLILRQIKESVRTSTVHNATVIANGLMHMGTTTDDFLRENLEWVSKAVNWNKFNAVASLGLMHRGHEVNAERVLEPYLPKGDMDQFGYKEGGALYAYGLIHANHGNDKAISYLMRELSGSSAPAVRHGVCLGAGLACLGTRNRNIYDNIKQSALYSDDAVTGEAAGLAMGLVMAGSMDDGAFNEMRQYIRETQHDKIQRGLRMGLACLAYGRLEQAQQYIDILMRETSNVVLRQTGVQMMALAYIGSGNAMAIEELLERVANDPSNDVKRFAAMGLGYVLCNDVEQCLNYVSALVEQWNGHIRYGAAMALGVACAGTGNQDAIRILEPMLQAKENFVRQGALISMAMVLVQQTAPLCQSVVDFRKTLLKSATDKSEDSIVKFGAIIAQGLLDAGGRNVTLSLLNRNGLPDMPAVLGTFVFMHHWYFYSMTHFICLAFRPTCLIGLNINLQMPKVEFRCNSKPSVFAYPPALEEKQKDEGEKVETAVLSTTKKKKPPTKPENKPTTTEEEKMEVDTPVSVEVEEEKQAKTVVQDEIGGASKKESTKTTVAGEDKKQSGATTSPGKESKEGGAKEEKAKSQPEPAFYTVSNPARAVRQQLRLLSIDNTGDRSRYAPIKPLHYGGIIMLRNTKPEESEEIVEQAVAGGTSEARAPSPDLPEPTLPTPFEFVFGDY